MGLASWEVAAHKWLPNYVRKNVLDFGSRDYVFLDIGLDLGVVFVVFAALVIWKAWKGRGGLEAFERLARRLSPLCLAALLPVLFDNRLWADWAVVFLALALAFGFGARAAARVVLETPPAFPRLASLRARVLGRLRSARVASVSARLDLPLVVAVAGACAYAVYFSVITITSHRNLATSSFDMGLEDNLMWNLVHGGPIFRSTPFDGPTGTHLRNHATFFSYVLAPIYWLAPGPETLLTVQATMMGAAAIPLHLWARRRVSAWMATLVALLYLAYPPLHGANLYDFHYLPLGVCLLWLVLFAVETRRTKLAIVASLLALSVREDVAFCLAVLGMFLLLTDRAPRAGAALAALGGSYFVAMKLFVMPHFGIMNGAESFAGQYAGLIPPGGHGFKDIIGTLVANPVFVANVVLEPDKVQYVLLLLVPILFLPLARPIGLLLVLPGFLFTLLATGYFPLTQISFQYTSYWTAFVFIGVVLELERARRPRHASDVRGPTRQRALAVGLVAASLACTFLYGAVLQRETVRGGFGHFVIGTTPADLARRADLAALVAQLPAGAKVASSEQVVPHVSGRESAYTLRFGIYDADYLLVQRPIRGDERPFAEPALRDGTFGVIDERGGFVLAKRGAPTTSNASVIARLGQ